MGPILDAFEDVAADGRHRLAIWSRGEGRKLDFSQLSEEVEGWRRRLSLPTGEPVGLAVGNRIAFPALFLALRYSGIPVVSFDESANLEEKKSLCETLGLATLLHTHPEGEQIADGIRIHRSEVEDPVTFPQDTALIKLSSGTTGAPLASCFTEEALCLGIRQIAEGMEIVPEDRVLVAIPLSHSYGFDNGVLSLAVLGTPLVLAGTIFPRPVITALREGEITFFPTVPPLVHSLAECDCIWPEGLALRTVICAGAPLRPEDAAAFRHRTGLAVHQFYGCTESGGIAYERDPESPEAGGTVGHPLPGVRIELSDEGEVVVHSAASYCGRWGDRGSRPAQPVHPGDRGEWTPQGRLRLIGRTADMLNVGGRKIPVARVESALLELPGIRDAAVLGVEDPVRGDRIVAYVVSDREHVDTTSLPSHLTPRELHRLDSLPHNERGKIDRARLREMAERNR